MLNLWKHGFRGRSMVIAITMASCQAFLLLGYDQGVMSGIIGAENRFARDFNSPDAALQGDIVGLYDIGCVFGSILCYFIGERYGRRSMLIIGGSIMIVGTILLATSTTVAQLIVGRIVTGFGNGMNSSTAPVYLSECAPAAIRGSLLTMQGTVTIFGVVISYWLDYGTSFTESSLQWRFPLAFQGVFAILLVLQMIGLPETPRWLVERERYEEARSVIAAIEDKPEDDPTISATLLDIRSGLEEEKKGGPFSVKELFSWGETQNLRRMILTISVEIMQQYTGSNMINYYAPVLFQENMGLSRNLSLILGGCAQIVYFIGSIIPIFLMDRFGRRALLLSCSAGLCVCFIAVTILLSIGTRATAYVATAFIFIFQLVIGVGWLPVPWFYPAEINTTRLRGRMQAVASGWNWMAVFSIVKITPIAFQTLQWRTYIIFAVLNAAFIPIVYCFYPETNGIQLEDIPLLFAKGGITGGVFSSKGGRTVTPNQHAQELNLSSKVEAQQEQVENREDSTTVV